MNWNAIGAVGQILGSLATFVTVGYLVIQVHNSEIDSRRALAQTRVERSMETSLALVNNERLAEVEERLISAVLNKNLQAVPTSSTFTGLQYFIGTVADQTSATSTQAYLLALFYGVRWNNFSETIIHLDDLLPADRVEFDHTLRATLGNPGFAFWYRALKSSLDAQAVGYVDGLNIEVGVGQSLSSRVKSPQSD